MKTRQTGVTLVEGLAAIVILSIVIASAVPHMLELRAQARQNELDGVAGTLASAMNINYAGCALTGHQVQPGKCVAVALCSQGAATLRAGMPDGYALDGNDPGRRNGSTANCAVVNSEGLRAEFVAISAGN